MTTKKLRGAVVGVGYLGTFHAQKYKNNEHLELVGVFDQNADQAKKVAADLGVKVFANLDELKGAVDIATVACSTQSHFEVAKKLLQFGIHLNVEKPLTATLPQSEELIALAKSKSLMLTTGHIERFNPSLLEARKHLLQNPLKQLHLIRRAPFKARGADVSVLHDLMIHDIDLMYWLTGSEVKSFQCSGAKILTKELDVASLSAVMENGTQVFISVSRVAPVTERSVRFEQEGQSLFVNSGTLDLEKVEASATALEPKVTNWNVEKADALQAETNAFAAAVLGQAELLVTGQDGLKALKLVEAIQSRLS